MFERSEVVFKILCAGVGALVLWQVVHAIQRSNPLAAATIPALPSLPASTNIQPADKDSSAPPSQPAGKPGTNVSREAAAAKPANPGTNAPQEKVPAHGANTVAHGANLPAQGMNAPIPPSTGKARTEPAARPGTALGMRNAGPVPGMPGQGPPLPPAVQARLDRIIESEILAPVIHPQPVALMGIIGMDAFLQAPDGQSGLIREGGELGGIKLLKLGINRALIEEAGEKRELTLHSGLGSESLLSKQTNSP
jgi:hypothetical protein